MSSGAAGLSILGGAALSTGTIFNTATGTATGTGVYGSRGVGGDVGCTFSIIYSNLFLTNHMYRSQIVIYRQVTLEHT